MAVNLFEWGDTIPWPSLGPMLNNKTVLKQHLTRLLKKALPPASLPVPTKLQPDYIDLYAEQVTGDAVADMKKYFASPANPLLTVGGLPTGFPPLFIQSKLIKPSNTAISCIGEGLAGWYLEQQGWVPLTRPIGEPVDLIFRDRTRNRFAFVQVKSTQEPDIKAQIRDSFVPLFQYSYNLHYQVTAIVCYIIGVIIKISGDFDILSLRIDFT